MNYAFTKSICIPAGTGSGMVIPVFSLLLEDWGLVVLIPFISPLSVIQSSPGTQVTHTLQWARSAGESDDTLKEFKTRGTQSGSVIRWGGERVRWWREGSYTIMMRLMERLNLLSSNVGWRNTEYTEMTNDWPAFWHLSSALWCPTNPLIIAFYTAH